MAELTVNDRFFDLDVRETIRMPFHEPRLVQHGRTIPTFFTECGPAGGCMTRGTCP
ncbi:hypothetical protein [Tsukamurella paurometabola]|uniref:Uncharacterized protein n=1 Tax=Tsukamurella paurometabola TaxID=2061 RepID=A0A3P8LDV5_TSUPA|nr:hypothetical protein [Tsukamurella paurometabola]MBS4103826.1 hypothetical protein [Tsukamurella paurometabola]VDR38432.1 Uncharacterised protein [Tsukamurella paurometabola]